MFKPFVKRFATFSIFNAAILSSVFGGTPIKIASVSFKYEVQEWSFVVNPKTGQAAIRLEYIYPPATVGSDDSDRGPAPKIAAVHGLKYDSERMEVIFDDGWVHAICAQSAEHKTVFGKGMFLKPTGNCVVSSHLKREQKESHWLVDPSATLDTYFEVPSR